MLAQASAYAPWDDRCVAEEAVTRGTDNWQWPDTLDAVAAAPAHHVVLLENEHVRVLEARVEAGDTVPLHTHRWPGVQYFLSLANFVRRDANGEVVVDSRAIHLPEERPLVLWGQPTPPHTLENVGEDPIHVIVVESKPPPDRPG
jgi:hypothetical protein